MKAFVVAVAVLVAAPARAEAPAVLVLQGGPTLAAEHERLVEALRIYTRDRDGLVLTEPGAPASPTAGALAEALGRARARGAAVVAWTARRADGGAVFYVLTAPRGELRETEIAPLGAERTAVDVALKVRALLPAAPTATATPTASAAAPAPAPAAAPDAGPAPRAAAPEPPANARPAAASPVAPAPPAVAARAVAAPLSDETPLPSPRLALGAGYGYFLPADSTWRRGGLVLSAELRVGHVAQAPLSIFVDAAVVERPTRIQRGFEVELRDTPLGAGALLRSHWGPLGAALGPRASLHILDVGASAPDGRSGSARRYAAGLGGRLELELRFSAYMKATAGATLEAMIPTQDFTIAGQPALGTGRALGVVTAGLAVLIL